MASPNLLANGTINPSTFVRIDSSSNNRVIACSAVTQLPIGIAQEGSKLAPIPGATSEAADAGDLIKVYGLGEICLLLAGSGGWSAGDRLTSSAAGAGVTAVTGNQFGAIALTTVTNGQLGRVQVVLGTM